MMKAKCGRCGANLGRVNYVEPDWGGQYLPSPPRLPLCKPCWKEADADEAIRKTEEKAS